MKTCPICKAVAFDDQTTCFGCLYDFTKEDTPEETIFPETSAPTVPASFLLSIVPQKRENGGFSWTCSVEPVRA